MHRNSDDYVDLTRSSGLSFHVSPEEFDRRLAVELNGLNKDSGGFKVFNDLTPSPFEKAQSRKLVYPTPITPSSTTSNSGYVVGKSLPSSVSLLPNKYVRHDDNNRRINTAKTSLSGISGNDEEQFDPTEVMKQLNDPNSDINYNSSGNNVFVLSCNAVTNMPVVPREFDEGVPVTTPQLKKRVNERYAEIHSLFTPPTNLTQHDVDVLNVTIEAKRYEEFQSNSPPKNSFENLAIQHEYELQKHVDRLKRPKETVPFGTSSPLPHYNYTSKSAGSSPLKRKRLKKLSDDPYSDSESTLRKLHDKSKARSPILTVDSFKDIAEKMKGDIKELVQDTIRSELMNMRKKQSRGGSLYVEPTTPNTNSVDGGGSTTGESVEGIRRRVSIVDKNSPRILKTPEGRTAKTPEGLEQAIERKIEMKLQKLNEELLQLKKNSDSVSPRNKDKDNTTVVNTITNASTSGKLLSPVKPPMGTFSPKTVSNKARKLVKQLDTITLETEKVVDNKSKRKTSISSGVVTFQDEDTSTKTANARKLSGISVTFSDTGSTPLLNSAPHNTSYNRNFSVTPGGSLIHSFIDENREYVGGITYEDYNNENRRRGSSKDFITVGTPAGPNLFGSTPVANRMSSPMFASEVIAPPPQSGVDGRAASPRSAVRTSPLVLLTTPTSSHSQRRLSNPTIISQATQPDHIDARATDVTIRVVGKDGNDERQKSNTVQIEVKDTENKQDNRNVSKAAEVKDDERLLIQKVNVKDVIMEPVPKNIVQPILVTKTKDRKLSIGTQLRQNESRELVSLAVNAGTTSAASLILAPTETSVKISEDKTASVPKAEVNVNVIKADPVETNVKSEDVTRMPEVVVVPKINEKPIVKEEPVVVQKVSRKNSKDKTDGNQKPDVVVVPKITAQQKVPPVVTRIDSTVIKSETKEELPVTTSAKMEKTKSEKLAVVPSAVRDAIMSEAGLRSRGTTSDIMAQYDKEQKDEEEKLKSAYGSSISSKILKRFESTKSDGIEVDMSEHKLSESEVAVLDSEYKELGKQIAQLSKIKSKIKKDLKGWVSDFEKTYGKPPTTADKLSIEDRFLAYKTVVTEYEDAKEYSTKIAEILKSSR